MVVPVSDEKGDQGGLPGPPHRTQHAARGPNTPRTRHLQPHGQTRPGGERKHRGAAHHLSRPRGLLGPCAATSGMHGPEGGGAQQCAPPTRPGGPPHRSQRAGLPHWAPALGSGVEAHDEKGCRGRAGGSHRLVMGSIRVQFRRVRWLRRRSALYQCRPTWVRKVATASVFPGTA